MKTNRALIVVDVQNDFCEGGALAVAGGDQVAKAIASFVEYRRDQYATIVATQDWHAPLPNLNMGHFAAPGTDPDFATSWPPHCVAGAEGANLHSDLDLGYVTTFKKGFGCHSYSGFEAVDPISGMSLLAYLRSTGITSLDVVGIATDYCVKATAIDAAGLGFTVRVLLSMCAGVDPDTTADAINDMEDYVLIDDTASLDEIFV